MRGTKAKKLRREAKARGEKRVPKLNPPTLMSHKGKPIFVPRRTRRMIVRQLLTDYRKGRLHDRQSEEE